MNLAAMVASFTERWGPKENEGEASYHLFLFELRDLLEAHTVAALEHAHGDPL